MQKCVFLHPRWFHRSLRNSFGMNGGDDETRTRDLCRDSMVGKVLFNELFNELFNASAAFEAPQ